MTDRINSFTVVLEKDIRDDDAEKIEQAILQIRGIISVKPKVTNSSDMVAYMRIKHVWQKKIYALFSED